MPPFMRSRQDWIPSNNTYSKQAKKAPHNDSQPPSTSNMKRTLLKRKRQEGSEGTEQRQHEHVRVPLTEETLPTNASTSDEQAQPRSKKKRPNGPTRVCSICLDDFEKSRLLQLSCGCPQRYCRGCLDQWYATSLRQREFPRCCKAEAIDNNIWDLLTPKTKRQYSDVLEERYAKVGQDKPLYCASCQGYIRHSQIRDSWGTCSACKRKTCNSCKSLRSEHKGVHVLCPSFLNDSATASLGPNFKRCPRCFILIEKASGCKEMR